MSTTDKDFRDLGTFIAYIFCRKSGLPEVSTEAEYLKLSNDVLLKHLYDANDIEAYDIAAYLIDYGRCSVNKILCRPFLWAGSRKLGFFRDGNDFMKSNGASKPNVKKGQKPRTHNSYIITDTMKFTLQDDGQDGWKNRFPEELVYYLEHPPKIVDVDPVYEPFSVLDLLKFLRNVIAHREQIHLSLGDAHAEFLANEELLIQYIRKKFPPLLTRLYNQLELSNIAKLKLANYFEPN